MKLRALLGAIVVAFTGCTVGEPPREPTGVQAQPMYVTLHGDTDFTPSERAELTKAATLWDMQTRNLASISIVWDLDFSSTLSIQGHIDQGHNVMPRMESWMELVKQADDHNKALLLGIVFPGGGIHNTWSRPVTVAFVADRFGEGYGSSLTHVALHEFGHLFGVDHIEFKRAIMYPYTVNGSSDCLKQEDLDAFCLVNECGTVKLSPCE